MNERDKPILTAQIRTLWIIPRITAYRIHLIGVKNLHVEVDAKYIKGMLNEPDLQPNAAINRWIQGILLFDLHLFHVLQLTCWTRCALSKTLGEGEVVNDEDDSWLDDIALWISIINSSDDPATILSTIVAEDRKLMDIYHFLTTLEAPNYPTPQDQKRFIRRATQFYVKSGKMWKRQRKGNPLNVILDINRRNEILTQAMKI